MRLIICALLEYERYERFINDYKLAYTFFCTQCLAARETMIQDLLLLYTERILEIIRDVRIFDIYFSLSSFLNSCIPAAIIEAALMQVIVCAKEMKSIRDHLPDVVVVILLETISDLPQQEVTRLLASMPNYASRVLRKEISA